MEGEPMSDDAPTGVLEILNVGSGHLEVKFDKANPAELARAARMVRDMLARGYAIFVEGKGGRLIPVRRFDPERGVYIVEDVPGVEEMAAAHPPPEACPRCGRERHRGRCRGSRREVPMRQARAVAVGRSAGG
jgi:hypothetical protein